MENTKYTVVASGRIMDGFELPAVVERLCSVSNLSQEEVAELFISGTVKKIKTAKSKEQALALRRRLRRLGLDCHVSVVTDGVVEILDSADKLAASSAADPDVSADPLNRQKASSVKWWVVGGLALLLLGVGVYSYLIVF